MARTGKRAKALRALLEHAGARIANGELECPTARAIRAAGIDDQVLDVYRACGGLQAEPRIQPGNWDIEADGVAVELDEDLHFNRYRRLTLDAPIYGRLTFPRNVYLRLCEDHEDDCLAAGRWGKRWSQPRAEVEFGRAGAPGDLASYGSPRWRQRAFYDFVKDTAPLVVGISVSRVPVWESIAAGTAEHQLGTLLELVADGLSPLEEWSDAAMARVRARTFTIL